MKTRPIHHRIMLLCALLLGMVVGSLGADPTNPRAPTPKPGPRFERETGFFNRLFGSRTERIDDDDDDDDEDDEEDEDDDEIRFRFRGPSPQYPPPPPGRIIITNRTRNGAPIRSEYPDPHLYPRVPEGTYSIAPPTWPPLYIPRRVQPSPPPPAPRVHFDERFQHVPDQTRAIEAPARIVVVPSGIVIVPTTPAASLKHPVTPPGSTTFATNDALTDAPSYQPQAQDAGPAPLSVYLPEEKALLPVSPSSLSFADQASAAVTPSPVPSSASPPSAEPPVSPPLPPFAIPVPGRPGLVYAPGKEATRDNLIDVTNFTRGTKVRDPVSNIIFRVP